MNNKPLAFGLLRFHLENNTPFLLRTVAHIRQQYPFHEIQSLTPVQIANSMMLD